MIVNTTSERQKRTRRHPEDKDAATSLGELIKATRKSRKWLTALLGKLAMGGGSGVKLENLQTLVDEAQAFAEQCRRVLLAVSTLLGKPSTASTTSPGVSGK